MSLKVLFLDDPDSLDDAEEYLRDYLDNLDMDIAASPEEALNMSKELDYEVVVADYGMSNLSDLVDFLHRFRRVAEEKPFVLLTEKENEEKALDALDVGADRYLVKREDLETHYKRLSEVISSEVSHYLMRRREKFLYSLIRLDLRNKTRIIQEYLGRIDESELSEDQREYLEIAKEVAESESDLVRKIRKIRNVNVSETEEVELDSLIENAIEKNKMKEFYQDCNISYQKTDCIIMGGYLLEEAFNQLIDNSLRHSDCNNIRIRSESCDGTCTVIIEDDGKGIPDDIKDDIFEMSWSGKGKRGSGVGLYLVKQILNEHGGNIELKESELGGTRFDITMRKV